jgi:hypothetical protein
MVAVGPHDLLPSIYYPKEPDSDEYATCEVPEFMTFSCHPLCDTSSEESSLIFSESFFSGFSTFHAKSQKYVNQHQILAFIPLSCSDIDSLHLLTVDLAQGMLHFPRNISHETIHEFFEL